LKEDFLSCQGTGEPLREDVAIAETTVVDEFGGVWLRHRGDYREESLHLDLTMSSEAGGDAVQVGIVVAGVTDELEGAGFGKGGEYLRESGACEVSGGGDAEGAVGSVNVRFAEPVEARLEAMEEGELHTSF
jgi:hypothetical protein